MHYTFSPTYASYINVHCDIIKYVYAFIYHDDRANTCKYCAVLKLPIGSVAYFIIKWARERFKIRMLQVPPFRALLFHFRESSRIKRDHHTKISLACSFFLRLLIHWQQNDCQTSRGCLNSSAWNEEKYFRNNSRSFVCRRTTPSQRCCMETE